MKNTGRRIFAVAGVVLALSGCAAYSCPQVLDSGIVDPVGMCWGIYPGGPF